jgi:hypothetical protein
MSDKGDFKIVSPPWAGVNSCGRFPHTKVVGEAPISPLGPKFWCPPVLNLSNKMFYVDICLQMDSFLHEQHGVSSS